MGSIEEQPPSVKSKLRDPSMFTGLIQQIGTISSISSVSNGKRLILCCQPWGTPIQEGESIAVNGCCLSVVDCKEASGSLTLAFDVIPQTLDCTTLYCMKEHSKVNIERALRADSFLGGHQVQGHVDGVETITSINTAKDEVRVSISTNTIDRDTLVNKGSVAINGVSLTIASIEAHHFDVALIPITLSDTTFGNIQKNDAVNVECDILTKTIAQVVRGMDRS